MRYKNHRTRNREAPSAVSLAWVRIPRKGSEFYSGLDHARDRIARSSERVTSRYSHDSVDVVGVDIEVDVVVDGEASGELDREFVVGIVLRVHRTDFDWRAPNRGRDPSACSSHVGNITSGGGTSTAGIRVRAIKREALCTSTKVDRADAGGGRSGVPHLEACRGGVDQSRFDDVRDADRSRAHRAGRNEDGHFHHTGAHVHANRSREDARERGRLVHDDHIARWPSNGNVARESCGVGDSGGECSGGESESGDREMAHGEFLP